MEKDLHYYGTYVAAILAGYNVNEATTIAHSAQYVDDLTLSQINSMIKRNYSISDYISMNKYTDWQQFGIDFVPTLTSQSNAEIFEINWKTTFNKDMENWLRRVWVNFHFLPGNFGRDANVVYQGAESKTGWKYGARSIWELQLLCQPSTSLVGTLVNSLKKGTLYQIGIMMHVLADTWSHSFYIGSPSWCFNEAGPDVYNITNGKHELVQWGILPGQEVSTPIGISYYSAAYLGHGRMGHLCDLPWLSYDYLPQWRSTQRLQKNNSGAFLSGIRQMYTALKCIRENTNFDPKQINIIKDQQTDQAIAAILKQEQQLGMNSEQRLLNRCNLWKEKIKSGSLIGNTPSPVDYSVEKWNFTSNEFKQFSEAARAHHSYINQLLLQNNINLYAPPPYDGY